MRLNKKIFMKCIFSLLSVLFAATLLQAQIKDPVQWSYTATKKADKVYTVAVTATVAAPWHIYSQTTPKGGPIPTKFLFKSNPLFSLDGIVNEEGKLEVIHDENFGVDVKYFSNKVVFVQTVKLKANVKTNISGTVEYMVCNDNECLPSKKLLFDIKLQ